MIPDAIAVRAGWRCLIPERTGLLDTKDVDYQVGTVFHSRRV